jgi:transcriptional regulator with XRE-family HTH domain
MAASSVRNIDGSVFDTQPPPRLTPAALKRARQIVGFSQQDLACKIRLSSTAISNFETGRARRFHARNERLVIDVFARLGVDLMGDRVVLRQPRRLAAAR